MKQSFSTALLLFALSLAASAQTPLYIQFDPSCMNQLEYKYTYSGQNLLMYSIAKSNNELYFFLLANKDAATSSNLPRGTVSCQNAPLTSSTMDAINAGGQKAFIVFRIQTGYRAMEVESGGYITRSGTYFAFRSPHYDFVMDTANIDYARNLSQPGVASPVYLTGRRDFDCQRLYAFRLEPFSAESPRADVEVIPGIGIVSDRTGRNGSEMEQNVYRLLKINGMVLEDYVQSACRGNARPGNNDGTFITNPGPNDAYTPVIEPSKEDYNTTPRPGGTTPLADCPEKPGYGYHIVQPGESLNYIARLYSLSSGQIAAWNNIRDPNRIEVCDKIWLSQQGAASPPPPPAQVANYHTVQKGETLVGIARKHNITEASIRQMNSFPTSGNVVIYPGQKITISQTAGIAPDKGGGAWRPPQQTTPPPPSSDAMHYRTKRGESLVNIAQQNGYTTHYFRYLNRDNQNLMAVRDDDYLPEGLVLTITDSKERIGFSQYSPPAPVTYNRTEGRQQFAPIDYNTPNGGSTFAQPQPTQTGFEYIGEHIVLQGETLAAIAQRYKTSVEKLAAANNLPPGQEPLPRTILRIPK